MASRPLVSREAFAHLLQRREQGTVSAGRHGGVQGLVNGRLSPTHPVNPHTGHRGLPATRVRRSAGQKTLSLEASSEAAGTGGKGRFASWHVSRLISLASARSAARGRAGEDTSRLPCPLAYRDVTRHRADSGGTTAAEVLGPAQLLGREGVGGGGGGSGHRVGLLIWIGLAAGKFLVWVAGEVGNGRAGVTKSQSDSNAQQKLESILTQ